MTCHRPSSEYKKPNQFGGRITFNFDRFNIPDLQRKKIVDLKFFFEKFFSPKPLPKPDFRNTEKNLTTTTRTSNMSQIRTTIFFLTIIMIITDGMMAAPTQQAQSDPRRRASIINYGKALAREAGAAVTRNIHSFTSNLRQYASTIPRDSAFKDFILPLHFTSNIGNLAAPYVSSKFVAKPIEKASVAVADWIDRVGATSDTLANFITSTLGIDGGDRKMVRRDIGNSSSLSS